MTYKIVLSHRLFVVIDDLDFIQKVLGPQGFDVILFEVDALVVKRFQIILLILLPPDL